MERKEAGKLIRKIIKDLGIKATYKTESSISFDFIVWIRGDDKDMEAVKKAVYENHLVYSDPTNDAMSDYFGCANSMVLFNGCCL